MSKRSLLTRRSIVAGAAALAAGAPAFIPRLGEAADTIKLGDIEELTGVFASQGRSAMRGTQMAVDAWNQRGGVMGRRIELIVEDDNNQPGAAVEKARRLIEQDKVAALVGTTNSGCTLAVSNTASQTGILFVNSGGHADQITGTDCHWNTFQVCHNAWMLTHGSGQFFAKQFGKRWYLITPDYAFGHSLLDGYQDVIKRLGGQVVGNDLVPIGTSEFSPYLVKVLAAKPSCLILNGVSGDDYINCMKQARGFGILDKIPIGGPYAQLETLWALPEEMRVGYYGCEWSYSSDLVLGRGRTAAHTFAADYRTRYGSPATEHSCWGYVAADRVLWAMQETKGTDAAKLARALERSDFHALWVGMTRYREVDHQLMWPIWYGKLRPAGTPQDKDDVFEVMGSIAADDVIRPRAQAATICHLNYP